MCSVVLRIRIPGDSLHDWLPVGWYNLLDPIRVDPETLITQDHFKVPRGSSWRVPDGAAIVPMRNEQGASIRLLWNVTVYGLKLLVAFETWR